MSKSENDREGLSPPPPNLLDLLEDDDDVYEPGTEESDLGTSVNEEESEGDSAGQDSFWPRCNSTDLPQMLKKPVLVSR